MANKRNKELKEKSADELQALVTDLTGQINKLSMLSIDKVKERGQIKNLKRDRARALTILGQQEK